MPRKRRILSSTGTYHIMLRGIDKHIIFEEEYDYIRFLQLLKKTRKRYPFKLHGYCLMNNHIHMIIQTIDDPLDVIMKSLGNSFVRWYNLKYQRRGHLFQDRFYSVPIENELQFLNTLRYIHNNPVKTGTVDTADDYKWSSSHEYSKNIKSPLSDTELAISISGSRHKLTEFLNAPCDMSEFDSIFPKPKLSDDDATSIILELSHCKTLQDFPALCTPLRNTYLMELYGRGLSVRQMSRLCGIPRKAITRVLNAQR